MSEIEIVEGSVEYLLVDVTADHALDSQRVEIALASTIDAASFADATWIGDAGPARTARLLLDGTLSAGKYTIFVRVTDSPEIPVVDAGTLRVRVR